MILCWTLAARSGFFCTSAVDEYQYCDSFLWSWPSWPHTIIIGKHRQQIGSVLEPSNFLFPSFLVAVIVKSQLLSCVFRVFSKLTCPFLSYGQSFALLLSCNMFQWHIQAHQREQTTSATSSDPCPRRRRGWPLRQ